MKHEKVISSMRSSAVKNYIIPGLNSYLLDLGKVRMFESTREYAGTLTPHSHRFDFACHMLSGEVCNRVYTAVSPFGDSGKKLDGDTFTIRTMELSDKISSMNRAFGGYDRVIPDETANYTSVETVYRTGDWYSMKANEIHSIAFNKDTKVIFFEGPEVTSYNKVLLPRINGETLETMDCDKPWMYIADDSDLEWNR
jgi:hypothetical protein